MLFSVLDVESTGLRIGVDEILSCHIIITDAVKIVSESTFYFKPQRITKDYQLAYEIHGISIAQARKFPNKIVSFLSLLEFIPDNSIMVCHSKKTNCYFDYGFLLMEMELYLNGRLDFYKKFSHVVSTHTLSKKFTKLKKRDLKSVSDHYGIKLDDHHNAKADAHACYEIFKIMYKDKKEEIERLIEYV